MANVWLCARVVWYPVASMVRSVLPQHCLSSISWPLPLSALSLYCNCWDTLTNSTVQSVTTSYPKTVYSLCSATYLPRQSVFGVPVGPVSWQSDRFCSYAFDRYFCTALGWKSDFAIASSGHDRNQKENHKLSRKQQNKLHINLPTRLEI
jgi:hypothetical protein